MYPMHLSSFPAGEYTIDLDSHTIINQLSTSNAVMLAVLSYCVYAALSGHLRPSSALGQTPAHSAG